MTLKWLQKGNLKRETESLFIAAQNEIRIDNFKVKIANMQNSKYKLYGDRLIS